MRAEAPDNVTQLLKDAATGDKGRVDALFHVVYDDLKVMAERFMRQERPDHTLQATAIVHEAYLKLIDQRSVQWRDRAHFFAVASQAIRRILVDHARAKKSAKRGGGRPRMRVEDGVGVLDRSDIDLVALDDALRDLAAIDALQSRLVEMRFFGGLTIEEAAAVLDIGKRSADREWACAKAWLYRTLTEESP